MPASFQTAQATIHGEWGSSPSSAFSSSASSSPIPPLPDDVLHSLHFPNRQRANATNDNVFEAHPQSAENSMRHSRPVQANNRDRAINTNFETRTQGNDGMDWSGLSNHDLDLIIAKLEHRALERRNKIRKIESLSQELGLSIHEQDWMAFLDRPLSGSGRGIVVEETCDHEEIHAPSDVSQTAESVPISGTIDTHNSVIVEDGSANSSSDVQAGFEAPRRSLRLLRGLKRAHTQVEQQRFDDTDCYEDGEAEQVGRGPLTPMTDPNECGGQSDSSMVCVGGVVRRTAWSVVLETYPQEIAEIFKPGELPTNKRVRSMLHLPAVNTLVKNSMQRAGTQEWHIPRRHSGVAAPDPCEKCQKGCGLWAGCYLRPADARSDQKRVCANCMIHGESRNCRWKQGPSLPQSGTKEAQM